MNARAGCRGSAKRWGGMGLAEGEGPQCIRRARELSRPPVRGGLVGNASLVFTRLAHRRPVNRSTARNHGPCVPADPI